MEEFEIRENKDNEVAEGFGTESFGTESEGDLEVEDGAEGADGVEDTESVEDAEGVEDTESAEGADDAEDSGDVEGKHFTGESIMSAAEAAAQEYGCSVDDLDYEMITDPEERETSEQEGLVEIVVYGVLEGAQGSSQSQPAAPAAARPGLPRKDPSGLSEEEFDHIADTVTDTIRDILKYFDAEDCEIDEYEGDDGEIILDVVGADLAYLIGRHGKTLDALQYAVTSITNRKLGYRIPVTVDVEGYKNRRREKIEQMANNLASRAIRQHGEVRLKPMNPYERRIVHIALKGNDRVETFSEGVDPDRYVVIKAL